MEGLTTHQKNPLERRSPACLNEIEVTFFIRTVKLIPDDGMPDRGGVNADLMHAPGHGIAAQQGKTSAVAGVALEAALDLEAGPGLFSGRMNHLFYPDR